MTNINLKWMTFHCCGFYLAHRYSIWPVAVLFDEALFLMLRRYSTWIIVILFGAFLFTLVHLVLSGAALFFFVRIVQLFGATLFFISHVVILFGATLFLFHTSLFSLAQRYFYFTRRYSIWRNVIFISHVVIK